MTLEIVADPNGTFTHHINLESNEEGGTFLGAITIDTHDQHLIRLEPQVQGFLLKALHDLQKRVRLLKEPQ